MARFIISLPLWQLIKNLGVLSYISLTIGICFGLIYTYQGWSPPIKTAVFHLHTFFTNAGMLVGILHGSITVIDPYMPFSWSEVLIPFNAQHESILNGLGTLATYGLLVIIFTSDIRHKITRKIWHIVHLLSYPVFMMSFIHGYFLGTDTHSLRWMYIISGIIVLLLSGIRLILRLQKTNAIPLPKY